MKTLKAFWHWVDNDRPSRITREHLSPVAAVALCMAESQVASRAFGDGSSWNTIVLWELCSTGDGSNPNERPEFHRPKLVAAVRDLSLAICPALEAMHEAVGGDWVLKDWIPPSMPDDTFRIVGRTDESLLSGVRVPKHLRLDRAREMLAGDMTMQAQKVENGYEARAYLVPFGSAPLASYYAPPTEEQSAAYQLAVQQKMEEYGYGFRPSRPGVVDDRGTLLLTIESCSTIERCNKFRGLRPSKIQLAGSEAQWRAALPDSVQYSLHHEVLAPMMLDGATFSYLVPATE